MKESVEASIEAFFCVSKISEMLPFFNKESGANYDILKIFGALLVMYLNQSVEKYGRNHIIPIKVIDCAVRGNITDPMHPDVAPDA